MEENGLSGCLDNKKYESIKSVYKICIETRNFEINQLIQRNNFFMLFQGVLLAAALQDQNSKPILELIVCITGIFVSFYQMQMASGAKYWQEWWESRLEFYEGELKKYHSEENGSGFFDLFAVSTEEVYQKVESRVRKKRGEKIINFLILNEFSVSRAPIKVSVVLFFSWVFLTFHTLDFGRFPLVFDVIKGFSFNQP